MLNWSKIRAITRVATAETDPAWLVFATERTTDEVEQATVQSPRQFERACAVTPSGPQMVPATVDLDVCTPCETQCVNSATVASTGLEDAGGVRTDMTQDVDAPPVQSAAPQTAPAPRASVPQPPPPIAQAMRLVKFTVKMTPAQYRIFEAAKRQQEARAGRRLSTADTIVGLCEAPTGSTSRPSINKVVLIHVDAASGQACVETERGPVAVPTTEVEDAMARGNVAVTDAPGPTCPAVAAPDGPQQEMLHLEPKARRRRPMTAATVVALAVACGGYCSRCRERGPLHVHHRQPWSETQTHAWEHLEVLCGGCHVRHHERDYAMRPDWAAARDRARATRAAAKGGHAVEQAMSPGWLQARHGQ